MQTGEAENRLSGFFMHAEAPFPPRFPPSPARNLFPVSVYVALFRENGPGGPSDSGEHQTEKFMHLKRRPARSAFFLSACFLFAALTGTLTAQQPVVPQTYNTTLFDALDPRPPVPPSGRYSALWGYTAPDGREYALLGGATGTHVIDITEKPITEVAFIPGPVSMWREMKTYSHYAYVVNETGEGLQIIDLSDLPASARLVKSDSTHFRTGHTITQEGDFLYVNGSNVEAGANQGTLIFNVAKDPLNPEPVGSYSLHYAHDVTIRNDTMYVAAINDGRLDIVYLGEDRTAPTLVTDIVYPGAGTHNSDLTSDGRYVMTTDEVGVTPKTLKVWDISDRENITKVADWTPAPRSIIHNVRIVDNLAYISWYTAGTRIVDISDPARPVQIAYFNAASNPAGAFSGNWEIYPYFKSGKLIASYMENGLYVFTLDARQKGSVRGVVRDAATGDPLPGAVIRVPTIGAVVTADAQGRYAIEGGTGSLDFSATAVNYLLREGSITLESGGAEQDILITPMELRAVRLMPAEKGTGQPLGSYSYNFLTRSEERVSGGGPLSLSIPKDSAYTIMVGAWGYETVEVPLPAGLAGDLPVPLQKGYADDAEVNLGWSLRAGSDRAMQGTWDRYAPRPGSYLELQGGLKIPLAPEEDRTPGAGIMAFATVGNGPHIDSGSTTLTSPLFDLSGYENPVLSFDLWYTKDAFFWLPTDDWLYFAISGDGGASWSVLEGLGKTTAGWEKKSYPLNQFLAPTDRMMFRVIASDSGVGGWVTAALDAFRITEGVVTGVETPVAGDSIPSSTLALFPNPLSGDGVLEVSLSGRQSAVWIDLLDGLGRRVGDLYSGELPEGKTRLPLKSAGLVPGIYILRFVADDGTVRYLPATVIR